MSWHAEMWVRLDMLEIADHSKCRFNWTVFNNAEWLSVKFSLPHIYTLPYFMWKMCSPSRRENHFFCDVMNCNKYPFIASIFVWIGYLPGISPIPFARNESKEKKRFSHYTFALKLPTAISSILTCWQIKRDVGMLKCSIGESTSSHFE